MPTSIAALPMYDWPEARAEVDAEWQTLRQRLHRAGIEAPASLVRRNADMPAVPGGIRDSQSRVIAPDPATLPPDELDLPTLWRHPALLLAQTCWGPLEEGLIEHVAVIGQPSYGGIDGGKGTFYSSAIVMRRSDVPGAGPDRPPPLDGGADLPLELFEGRRLAFNSRDSMSGWLALARDLDRMAAAPFGEFHATGGHRASVVAVATGQGDVAAVDCRSWALARRFEPAAADLLVVGWTSRRLGLPYISAPGSGLRDLPLD